jgi:ABC exporter DevB family membrane fusion protein
MTRTTRRLLYAGAGVAAVAGLNLAAFAGRSPSPPANAAANSTAAVRAVVAGPGRVEALSEDVRVSAQLGGKLRAVMVEEGDRVSAGQLLAVLENDDYRARVQSAQAELRAREADARRVVNGARDQERREAAASLQEAEAVLDHARLDHQRRRDLFTEQVISRAEMDQAEEQIRVATARVEALRQRRALVDADAREEDASRASSDVALAKARLDEARAMLEKTFVRAPISGIVLRRHRRAGESVSTQFDSPIVTLADRSIIRIRVDVDETDIGRVSLGQPAYVTAEAFGTRRFAGKVVRIGQTLGKKNVRTDEPTERVDQKVLETLLELEDGHELPIGLRVQAFVGQ